MFKILLNNKKLVRLILKVLLINKIPETTKSRDFQPVIAVTQTKNINYTFFFGNFGTAGAG